MALQMEFSGSPEVRADRAAVWRRVIDPHFVAQSAPGVQTVHEIGPDRYRVASVIGIGPVKFEFAVEITISDLVEPERARLRAAASAHGTTVAVDSAVRLESVDTRTAIHWHAKTEIDGTLAGIGSKMVEGVARKLTSDFWDDFARRVEADATSRA